MGYAANAGEQDGRTAERGQGRRGRGASERPEISKDGVDGGKVDGRGRGVGERKERTLLGEVRLSERSDL